MADYYGILGIERTADVTQLKAAYKRHALAYHPDRNPGNPEAEEMFKAINEAYQVLSDPLKRSRYDSRTASYDVHANQAEFLWKEMQRRRYQQWQASQQTTRYRFDREYFRIQGLAFLTFLIISGICFGIIHIVTYYHEQRLAEIDLQNRKLVMEVNTMFNEGHLEEALVRIRELRDNNPLEFQFYFAHDSLLHAVRDHAEQEFDAQNYSGSIHLLEILMKYETPSRKETLRKLAMAEYYSGNFEKALQSMKQIYSLEPWNLELLYQIGNITLVNLNNPEQALQYFTLGKKIFKDNSSRIYGAAFEVVMDPVDAPTIYYELFEARARTNLILKNYAEAETDCNWAIFLRPKNPEPYKLRVQANIQQQKYYKVCRDLNTAKQMGAADLNDLQRRYCR